MQWIPLFQCPLTFHGTVIVSQQVKQATHGRTFRCFLIPEIPRNFPTRFLTRKFTTRFFFIIFVICRANFKQKKSIKKVKYPMFLLRVFRRQLLAENSSPTNDADDAPFEFSARESLTPEPSSPNDDLKDSPLKEASLSSNTGTDDVQMDPFVAGDAPINTPSTASTAPSSTTSSGGGKESQESSSKKPHSDGSHITWLILVFRF